MHNGDAGQDPRVQRTRKLLQDALIELTIEKGFAAVTVRDLAKFARVNRATFYRHYQDKFDLLEQYAHGVYKLLDASSAGQAANPDRSPSGLVRLLEHVESNAQFYRVMLGTNGYPAFAQQIQKYIEGRLRRSLPAALMQGRRGKAPVELCLSYMSNASLGAIMWWLEHGLPYTAQQMATFAFQLSSTDLRSALELDMPPRAKQAQGRYAPEERRLERKLGLGAVQKERAG